MENPKELFRQYQNTGSWNNVSKTHENLFVLGAESIMLRGTTLLNGFFNSKMDANKFLTAEQQEDLEKEFGEWCKVNAT